MIIKTIKFLIVCILGVLYWPMNYLLGKIKKPYLRWEKEDKLSFILATPLYYLFFIIVVILSVPLEMLGEEMAPTLSTFK